MWLLLLHCSKAQEKRWSNYLRQNPNLRENVDYLTLQVGTHMESLKLPAPAPE